MKTVAFKGVVFNLVKIYDFFHEENIDLFIKNYKIEGHGYSISAELYNDSIDSGIMNFWRYWKDDDFYCFIGVKNWYDFYQEFHMNRDIKGIYARTDLVGVELLYYIP